MMHQNKGAIHHSFPAPCRRETFPNDFNHALQGNKEQGATIITDKCLQSVSELSVVLITTKYGGQCLRGYMLEPYCLVSTQSGGKRTATFIIFKALHGSKHNSIEQIKTRAQRTHCRYLRWLTPNILVFEQISYRVHCPKGQPKVNGGCCCFVQTRLGSLTVSYCTKSRPFVSNNNNNNNKADKHPTVTTDCPHHSNPVL